MTIRSTILTTFETVGREQEKTLAPLSDDLPLLESGLDSLCIAIIVARLEGFLEPVAFRHRGGNPVSGDGGRLRPVLRNRCDPLRERPRKSEPSRGEGYWE